MNCHSSTENSGHSQVQVFPKDMFSWKLKTLSSLFETTLDMFFLSVMPYVNIKPHNRA